MGLNPTDFLTLRVRGGVVLTRNCMFTGREHSVALTTDQWDRWCMSDDLIQNVLPELSTDDREFLISGISPEGWSKAFPEHDYLDEEEK